MRGLIIYEEYMNGRIKDLCFKNHNRKLEMENEEMVRIPNNYFLHVLRNRGERCAQARSL